MADPDARERAVELWREACRHQMAGDLDRAIETYKRSIEVHPTAEAHTYLGGGTRSASSRAPPASPRRTPRRERRSTPCAASSTEGPPVMKLDHLALPVTDVDRSRRWYVETLGLTVEFEVPDRRTVALKDTGDFTIFLQQASGPVEPRACALYFQVADVDATFAAWSSRGVELSHAPRKSYWGYGAELKDPDGYLVRLWDERSMKEK
jgi:predicted enzyme related to lactoylglutathione lyase